MENILENDVQQAVFIEALLMAMPDAVKFYPKVISLIDALDNGVDDFLNGEKMVVLTKKGGVVLLLVLDTKKEFTLNQDVMLEGTENPIINKYEKSEWKNKILNSAALQILKEKYEKTL